MVAYIKEHFSKSAAEEFVCMFYHISLNQGGIDEPTARIIDDIVPAVTRREQMHQTISIPTAQQVNINPQRVINSGAEEE